MNLLYILYLLAWEFSSTYIITKKSSSNAQKIHVYIIEELMLKLVDMDVLE